MFFCSILLCAFFACRGRLKVLLRVFALLCFALLRGWGVGKPHTPRSRRTPSNMLSAGVSVRCCGSLSLSLSLTGTRSVRPGRSRMRYIDHPTGKNTDKCFGVTAGQNRDEQAVTARMRKGSRICPMAEGRDSPSRHSSLIPMQPYEMISCMLANIVPGQNKSLEFCSPARNHWQCKTGAKLCCTGSASA